MSSTLKRQNHRIHPCNASRKNELLAHLAAVYGGKKILVVTAGGTEGIALPETPGITLISDETLAQAGDLACDIVISYDLPEKALLYMARIARAREYALVLMDADEQKRLYPIETLLGRTIIQETVAGFEPDFGIAAEKKSKEEAKARRAEREKENAKRDARPKRDFKPRPDGEPQKKRGDDKGDQKKGGRRSEERSESKYLGRDENGKPIFSGKTRERNHYIDGTPRTPAEKAYKTPYGSKPKFYGKEETKSDGTAPSKGKSGSPKGGKKPYDKKPYDKKGGGEGKGAKPSAQKNPSGAPAEPKRPPRRITVKSLKPKGEKE